MHILSILIASGIVNPKSVEWSDRNTQKNLKNKMQTEKIF